jgi:alkylation response protein AidB-like acyl-CoA dehydrogenase
MDFSIDDPLREILTKFRTLVDERVLPLESELHARPFRALTPELDALRAEARARGLWLPHLPREDGGMGLSLVEHGLVSEVLGRSPLGHYAVNAQAPDAGNMEILREFGSAMQRERFLAPLLAGEVRSCFAMTEPEHAGSNPLWLSTTARRDGDAWIVDGHKWFTTGADGAAFAIVMAITHPDAPPHLRASMIIVPTDTPGFLLVRNVSVMGDEGSGWASHGEVRFDGCRVPADHLLGGAGAGFAIAQSRLGPGRIHHCMRWIGVCERALSLLVTRAATRELAPDYMLGQKQIVHEWIAESRAEIDAARLLVLHTAWEIERKGMKASKVSISSIKFHVAGVMQRVLDRAIQVHGALGMTDDTVLSFLWRHERGARIYDGPDEVHKSVVAKSMLEAAGLARRDRGGRA